MKALALEYIVKYIILIAVMFIVISFVIYFFDDIKRLLEGIFSEKQPSFGEIRKDSFTTEEIFTYIILCYDKIPEKVKITREGQDIICYSLYGDMENVDEDSLIDSFNKRYPDKPPYLRLDRFDTAKSYVNIIYRTFEREIELVNE